MFFTKTVLFIGYGLEDNNINDLIVNANNRLGNKLRYYAVMKDPTDIQNKFWESNNVTIFNVDVKFFLDLLSRFLGTDHTAEISSFKNLWEVRKKMEISSVALAAKNRTDRDILDLEDCLKKFENVLLGLGSENVKVSDTLIWRHDFDFHSKIALASQNILFYDLYRSLYRSLIPLSKQVQSAKTLRQHNKIYESIENGNLCEAVKRMKYHMDYVRNEWEKNLK